MRRMAIFAALASAACTHRIITVHDPLPEHAPAVHAVMDRQIRNAVDAGEGDAELRQLRALVAAQPDEVGPRLQLAAHYRERGFPDLELEHYRLAAARFPESAPAALALAKALRAAGNRDEAQGGLVAFCKRNAQAPASLFAFIAVMEDDAGNFASAEPWHRVAVLREPASDAFHNNLGYNLLLQARASEAAAEFRRALELNAHSAIARNNLGIALAANPNEAVLQWQSISDPATAHNNLAAVFIEQKRYAEARQQIRIALDFSPRHPAALENLELLGSLDPGVAATPPAPVTTRHRLALTVRKVLGAN